MRKKTFYIIRHAQKMKAYGDPVLTQLGEEQARLTAKYLTNFPITRIITSSSLRAKQTARYITNELELNFEISEFLKERVNWGEDPQQTFADFLIMWKKASKKRNWQPPLGDSSLNSGRRLEKVVTDLLTSTDEHIVLVTHGGIITDFLRNVFTKNELNRFIQNFESTLDVNIKECSLTILEVDPTSNIFNLKELASVEHLH